MESNLSAGQKQRGSLTVHALTETGTFTGFGNFIRMINVLCIESFLNGLYKGSFLGIGRIALKFAVALGVNCDHFSGSFFFLFVHKFLRVSLILVPILLQVNMAWALSPAISMDMEQEEVLFCPDRTVIELKETDPHPGRAIACEDLMRYLSLTDSGSIAEAESLLIPLPGQGRK